MRCRTTTSAIISALLLIAGHMSILCDATHTLLAVVGERVVLKCHTDLSASVIWTYQHISLKDEGYRDIVLGGEVIDGNKMWFELSQPKTGDYDLVIRSATVNNTGFYTCTEDDGLGAQHNIYLSINDFVSSPEADGRRAIVSSEVGQRLTLTCHTDLASDVVWTYRRSLTDGKHKDLVLEGEVIDGNKANFELSQPSPGDFDLVIRSVTFDNTGFYTCAEDDGFGRQHHTYLRVSEPERKTQKLSLHEPQVTPSSGMCQPGEYYDSVANRCVSCGQLCHDSEPSLPCRSLCPELASVGSTPNLSIDGQILAEKSGENHLRNHSGVVILAYALPVVIVILGLVVFFSLAVLKHREAQQLYVSRRGNSEAAQLLGDLLMLNKAYEKEIENDQHYIPNICLYDNGKLTASLNHLLEFSD